MPPSQHLEGVAVHLPKKSVMAPPARRALAEMSEARMPMASPTKDADARRALVMAALLVLCHPVLSWTAQSGVWPLAPLDRR